jgi:hypothetical protein
MSKLKYIEDAHLAWVTITEKNFSESGADARAIPPLLMEVRNNFSLAKLLVVFWENHLGYFGIAHGAHAEHIEALAKLLNGERRDQNVVFALPSKDILEQQNTVAAISRELKQFEVQ